VVTGACGESVTIETHWRAVKQRTPGVYVGLIDRLPFGAAMNKAITINQQTHVPRYFEPLVGRIESGEIDPSFVVTHRLPLEGGAFGVPDVS
jgi:threonine dehydrogenase-like Zn-dependent dehydrogenase